MAFTIKSVQLSSFNKKSFLLAGGSILVVLVLVFIPEIIAFQERVTGKSDSNKSQAQLESGAVNESEELSTQDERASLKVENPEPELLTEIAQGGQSPLERLKSNLEGKLFSKKKVAQTSKVQNRSAVTWDVLHSDIYQNILLKSRTQALTLVPQLTAEQERSKYALVSFANGVAFILKNPGKVLSAQEAVSYLQDLHGKVNKAFIEEKVAKHLLSTWRAVSLGAIPTYDAATLVRMERQLNEKPLKGKKRGKISVIVTNVNRTAGTLSVSVSGVAHGKDIGRVEVYRNGNYVLDANRRAPQNSFVQFDFRVPDGTGIFSIRAITQKGLYYEKRYQLLPEDVIIESEEEGEEGQIPTEAF